jgi:hypothetical protein
MSIRAELIIYCVDSHRNKTVLEAVRNAVNYAVSAYSPGSPASGHWPAHSSFIRRLSLIDIPAYRSQVVEIRESGNGGPIVAEGNLCVA